MRLMLDTNALLWWREAATPLSRRAHAEIADGSNEILVSIVSLWEITIKRSIGKLAFPDDLETVLQEERFNLLPIWFQHLRALDTLPQLHRDPFDRLLLAQSGRGAAADDHQRSAICRLRREPYLVGAGPMSLPM